MNTFYVKQAGAGGDGTKEKPFAKLAQASAVAKSGDMVLVGEGVYHEELKLETPNVTWRSVVKRAAIIDGGYNESKKGQGVAGTLPGNKNGGLVSIRAAGVVFDGFTIRYAGGNGVSGANCPGAKVLNCRIYHTYVSSIKIAPDKLMEGVLIEGNVCTQAGMQSFDATATGGKDPGGGVIKVGYNKGGVIRNNICALSYGEGINIGKGNEGFTCEGNEVFLVSHKHIYINRSANVLCRGNFCWYIPGFRDIDSDAAGDAPGGIGIGDECGNSASDPTNSCANDAKWIKSKNVRIENNTVVGLGMLFYVTNGAGNEGGGGYNTVLDGCTFTNNTFVAGPLTTIGIKIGANMKGNPHKNSIFADNLIDWSNAPAGAQMTAGGPLQGVKMHHNLWSTKPEAQYLGAGDVYGSPGLVKANAAISVTNQKELATTFTRSNYNLLPSSLARGKSSTGKDIGAMSGDGPVIEPPDPPVEPPPPPPPPPVTDEWSVHYDAGVGFLVMAMAEFEKLRKLLDKQ